MQRLTNSTLLDDLLDPNKRENQYLPMVLGALKEDCLNLHERRHNDWRDVLPILNRDVFEEKYSLDDVRKDSLDAQMDPGEVLLRVWNQQDQTAPNVGRLATILNECGIRIDILGLQPVSRQGPTTDAQVEVSGRGYRHTAAEPIPFKGTPLGSEEKRRPLFNDLSRELASEWYLLAIELKMEDNERSIIGEGERSDKERAMSCWKWWVEQRVFHGDAFVENIIWVLKKLNRKRAIGMVLKHYPDCPGTSHPIPDRSKTPEKSWPGMRVGAQKDARTNLNDKDFKNRLHRFCVCLGSKVSTDWIDIARSLRISEDYIDGLKGNMTTRSSQTLAEIMIKDWLDMFLKNPPLVEYIIWALEENRRNDVVRDVVKDVFPEAGQGIEPPPF